MALERIRHHIIATQQRSLDLPLYDGIGLICAEDICAAHATPAEPRASVDGYTFASRYSRHAEPNNPAGLQVLGLIRPSTASPAPIAPGQAAAILTGGPLPPGADCVVAREDVEISGAVLCLPREVLPFEHVRAPGSDLKAGTGIVRRGEELTPSVLATLAVSGTTRVKAYAGPKVLVLALGNELSALEAETLPGKMPADNLIMAGGLLRYRGVQDAKTEVCANELATISAQLEATDAQCIITMGGTGPGDRDFIMDAALGAGFVPLFNGLKLTPGKSMFAAVRGTTLLFALPGTPWAVFALMHALVLPAICWLRGRNLPVPGPILARPQLLPPLAQLGWERLVPCTNSALGAELLAQPLLDRSREGRLDMLQAQGLLIVTDKADPGELLPMIPIWENNRGLRLG